MSLIIGLELETHKALANRNLDCEMRVLKTGWGQDHHSVGIIRFDKESTERLSVGDRPTIHIGNEEWQAMVMFPFAFTSGRDVTCVLTRPKVEGVPSEKKLQNCDLSTGTHTLETLTRFRHIGTVNKVRVSPHFSDTILKHH